MSQPFNSKFHEISQSKELISAIKSTKHYTSNFIHTAIQTVFHAVENKLSKNVLMFSFDGSSGTSQKLRFQLSQLYDVLIEELQEA
ncbi:hypothetical protein DID76_01230 [Candidatus Marinamargulisbacteria bacterium SCGC AG-414-C22]|nr:hypothetical protein DID76_01230 [Candidatus Marinamargulisbacteria bacterium SCGC AG-414-C22]